MDYILLKKWVLELLKVAILLSILKLTKTILMKTKRKLISHKTFHNQTTTTFSEDERQVLLSLGLEVKNEDGYYWIVGNTYGLNEKIKQLGYRFHSEKKHG